MNKLKMTIVMMIGIFLWWACLGLLALKAQFQCEG